MDLFEHQTSYNADQGRIEMHLVSRIEQEVRIEALSRTFHFAGAEKIYTESSYKFSPGQIEHMGRESGFEVTDYWTDEREYFRVNLLRPAN